MWQFLRDLHNRCSDGPYEWVFQRAQKWTQLANHDWQIRAGKCRLLTSFTISHLEQPISAGAPQQHKAASIAAVSRMYVRTHGCAEHPNRSFPP